jgi:hypothetical protein
LGVQDRIDKLCGEVLKRISPSEEDRKRIETLARKLEEKVAASAKKKGVEAVVRVEGSVAKDASGVHACHRRFLGKKSEINRIAREAAELKQVERFTGTHI